MMFRIGASIATTCTHGVTVKQIPLFALEGDIHGFTTEAQAEAFAVRFLSDITGARPSDIHTCAVLLDEV
jgi:hypothetical protein